MLTIPDRRDAAVDLDLRDDVSGMIPDTQAPFLTSAVQILRRVEENAPDAFKGRDRRNVEIVRDIVGIRPAREGGVRIEKEVLDGQNIVHAYGKPFQAVPIVANEEYYSNLSRDWRWWVRFQFRSGEGRWNAGQ